MKCTNCGKMVPDSAKICGYCGHRLKSEIGPAAVFQTPSAGESNKKPRNRGITGLLIGAGIVIIGLIVAIIFIMARSNPLASSKLSSGNTIIGTIQEFLTGLFDGTGNENNVNSSGRCALFSGLDMKLAYYDWEPGSALLFYLTIPGGVPGLEKQIPFDTDNWIYSAKIGDYNAEHCTFQGYKEWLFCQFVLPEGYSNTMRDLSVSVNGCSTPIFSQHPAYLPKFVAAEPQPGGSNNDGGGLACIQPADANDFGAMDAYCACEGKGVKYGFAGYFCFGNP